MYPALGIRTFHSKTDYDADQIIGLGLSDESFLRQTLPKLRALRQPFFAFIVTLTSHYPFDFPEFGNRDPLPLGELQGTLLGNYLRMIHYTDRQLGTFLRELKTCGLADRSLVALYGDHHALTGVDASNLERLLGRPIRGDAAWKRLQTVPFAVRVPGATIRGTREVPVGQVDIGPTLANLLGVRLPTALGRDVFSDKAGLEPFRNGSFLWGNLWVQPDGTATDLSTGEPRDGSRYAEQGRRTRDLLRANDLMLEENLVPRLDAAMAR
jgi:phosphoglycerol transferase MdoB-like AlkP superfamily enzyme